MKLTPSSPWGLLAMRSFQPSPADRRDLTSCFDFWESCYLFSSSGSLQTRSWVQTTYPQSITHCLYALRKRIVSLLSSVGAAPVRYLGDSLLGLDGSLLKFANEESACLPFLKGLRYLKIC